MASAAKSPDHFLAVAEQARLTLLGRLPGVDFWKMPHGRPFVLLCYRNNIELARKARLRATLTQEPKK